MGCTHPARAKHSGSFVKCCADTVRAFPPRGPPCCCRGACPGGACTAGRQGRPQRARRLCSAFSRAEAATAVGRLLSPHCRRSCSPGVAWVGEPECFFLCTPVPSVLALSPGESPGLWSSHRAPASETHVSLKSTARSVTLEFPPVFDPQRTRLQRGLARCGGQGSPSKVTPVTALSPHSARGEARRSASRS